MAVNGMMVPCALWPWSELLLRGLVGQLADLGTARDVISEGELLSIQMLQFKYHLLLDWPCNYRYHIIQVLLA